MTVAGAPGWSTSVLSVMLGMIPTTSYNPILVPMSSLIGGGGTSATLFVPLMRCCGRHFGDAFTALAKFSLALFLVVCIEAESLSSNALRDIDIQDSHVRQEVSYGNISLSESAVVGIIGSPEVSGDCELRIDPKQAVPVCKCARHPDM